VEAAVSAAFEDFAGDTPASTNSPFGKLAAAFFFAGRADKTL